MDELSVEDMSYFGGFKHCVLVYLPPKLEYVMSFKESGYSFCLVDALQALPEYEIIPPNQTSIDRSLLNNFKDFFGKVYWNYFVAVKKKHIVLAAMFECPIALNCESLPVSIAVHLSA